MTVPDRALPPSGPELRSYAAEFEVRAVAGATTKMQLTGYASVFDSPYQINDAHGEYTETVKQGAFTRTLADRPDVVYLGNHEGLALASTASGSLRLEQDTRGLLTVATLNTGRGDARDLVAAVEDGDIQQMSFAFRVYLDGGQEWVGDQRFLRALNLDKGDVSAVNFGASPATNVALRRSLTASAIVPPASIALLRRKANLTR